MAVGGLKTLRSQAGSIASLTTQPREAYIFQIGLKYRKN